MATRYSAFTLVELAIVLVIIGLIVGGVLVGRDLINSAEVNATVSQIQKYQTAVHTFRGKYAEIPGDLSSTNATRFGFTARSQCKGGGNGDGVIEGNIGGCLANWNRGYVVTIGETSLFWVDLTTANGLNVNLIDGGFSAGTSTTGPGILTGSALDAYFPQAKIKGNYIYVWSGGPAVAAGVSDGLNYFSLANIDHTDSGGVPYTANVANSQMLTKLSVQQAMAIDQKLDDGLPQSGTVIALHPGGASGYASWAAGNLVGGASGAGNTPTTTATAGSATTCYDNANVGGGGAAIFHGPEWWSGAELRPDIQIPINAPIPQAHEFLALKKCSRFAFSCGNYASRGIYSVPILKASRGVVPLAPRLTSATKPVHVSM